ncbi:MAG TPA: hypothetical protein PKJ97_01590 [Candidatus Bilamarchaeaceae archaeon]|nr:hypothetical protein [Candidatus Bilamarchaeaceae archaeon]
MKQRILSASEPPIAARRDFQTLLRHRELQLSGLERTYWKIIGNGPIGGKAEMLLRSTWAIERAGFTVLPRTVLAMDVCQQLPKQIESFFKWLERARKSAIVKKATEIFPFAEHLHLPGFMVVRSSAHGDSAGTGAYRTLKIEDGAYGTFDVDAPENPGKSTFPSLLEAISGVLQSHDSEKARFFRERCGLPEGIAVIIEPNFFDLNAIGRSHNIKQYAQRRRFNLGGIAYTSANSAGACVVGAQSAYQYVPVHHHEYAWYTWRGISIFHPEGDFRIYPFREDRNLHLVPCAPTKSDVRLFLRLSKMLKKLESLVGPSYVEWVASPDDSRLGFGLAIVQIDPMEPGSILQLGKKKDTLLRSGVVCFRDLSEKFSGLVVAHNAGGLTKLMDILKDRAEYLLFFPHLELSACPSTEREKRSQKLSLVKALVAGRKIKADIHFFPHMKSHGLSADSFSWDNWHCGELFHKTGFFHYAIRDTPNSFNMGPLKRFRRKGASGDFDIYDVPIIVKHLLAEQVISIEIVPPESSASAK